ncbi:hypothetical protein DIS24_g12586, partial [Lasiodiplodia hormozganensis]
HQSSPPSRAPLILLGNILPQSLATLFVLARITTRSLLSRHNTWGPDDTTLTLSWLSSLALTTLSCLQTRYGAGQHLATVPLSNLKPSLQLAYATLLLYNLTLCLTKVSVSLFYLRVFADRWNKPLSLAALAFVVVYTVPLEVVSIAQTIIAAIIRAVRISTILRSADKTWVSYDSSIWSAVEVDVGLICASAPATWKLVKKVAPRFAEAMTNDRSSSPSSGRGGGGGGGGEISSGSNGTDDALNDAGGGGGPQ